MMAVADDGGGGRGTFQFTVDAGRAGFTDQLSHLEFLGEAGVRAGGAYAYRPVRSVRSVPPRDMDGNRGSGSPCPSRLERLTRRLGSFFARRDVCDVLGVNNALRHAAGGRVAPHDCDTVELELTDEWIDRTGATSFREFVDYLGLAVRGHAGQGSTFRLVYRGPIKRFRLLFHEDAGPGTTFWDPVGPLMAAANRCGTPPDVLVHFRAGDLAVIPVAKGFTAARERGRTVGSTANAVDPGWVEPSELLNLLVGCLPPGTGTSAEFHSDGFARAYKLADAGTAAATGRPGRSPSAAGRRADRSLAASARAAGCGRIQIGETRENLRRLLSAALGCRVAVVTHRGLMLPKLFCLLARHGWEPPALIIAYRGGHPNPNIVRLDTLGARLLAVDLDRRGAVERVASFLVSQLSGKITTPADRLRA